MRISSRIIFITDSQESFTVVGEKQVSDNAVAAGLSEIGAAALAFAIDKGLIGSLQSPAPAEEAAPAPAEEAAPAPAEENLGEDMHE